MCSLTCLYTKWGQSKNRKWSECSLRKKNYDNKTVWFFQKIKIDIYFRQFWVDERLIALYDYITTQTNDSSESIQLGNDYIDLIWLPDIYWVDAVVVSKPGVLAKSQSLKLSYDGSVFFSSRLLVEFRCEMKLKYFPLDIQECQLCFESC